MTVRADQDTVLIAVAPHSDVDGIFHTLQHHDEFLQLRSHLRLDKVLCYLVQVVTKVISAAR